MITIRLSKDRGLSVYNWLKSRHTFSFSRYYDPAFMGFFSLRVINEDIVAPHRGFDSHHHDNMEIISYVISGVLEHKDSMGNGSLIKPGEIQRMSAGSGVEHSEQNNSATEPVHFFQIWILPKVKDIRPSYEQKSIEPFTNGLKLIVSSQPSASAISINQDIEVYLGRAESGRTISYTGKAGHGIWIQVVSGALSLQGNNLAAGDGAAITEELDLQIQATQECEFLLFDMVQ